MSDIDEVKSRLDIADYIGKRVTLKKAGRNLKGLCPFHGEKTPSFMVNPDRQAFHCFGCGKGGSIIDFVMEYEKIDFREALFELAEQAGVSLTPRIPQTLQEKRNDRLLEMHHLAAEYYHYLLKSHAVGENARTYIKNRGVSEKIIETFFLGYSAQSWDGLAKFLRKKGYEDDLLIESGLIIASAHGGYDRFRGRLMFPLRDHRGQVIGFSGRILDAEAKDLPAFAAQKALQAGAKYINSPETPIYTKGNMLFALDITKSDIQKEEVAVLMEGEFDVLSSYQAGIGNVVAIKGTALTEAQVRLLKRFTKNIVFALDSDVAGDAASRRGIEIAEKAGLEIHVAQMPFGKDPDEVARTEPGNLKKAIKDAQSIYDYYISSALKRFDVSTAYGKKNMSDELLPILAKIENPIVQSHYVRRVSEILVVSESVITSGMKKVSSQKTHLPQAMQPAAVQNEPPEDKQELLLLSLLLQGNTMDLFEDLSGDAIVSIFHSGAIRQIIERLGNFLAKEPHFFLRDFLDQIPKELQPTIDHAFLLDVGSILEDPDIIERTWQQTMRELKKKLYFEKIQELMKKQKAASEEDGKVFEAEIAKIATELRRLEILSES